MFSKRVKQIIMKEFTRQVLMILTFLPSLIVAQNIENEPGIGIEIYSGQQYVHQAYSINSGNKQNLFSASCFKNISKLNGVWLKYNPKSTGELSFKIKPIRLSDDIDFVVYKSDNNNILVLDEIACSSAGPILSSVEYHSANLGITGAYEALGNNNANHSQGNTNSINPLSVDHNYTYYILVLNYESLIGFSIELEEILSTSTETVSVFGDEMELTLYPNPASSQLNIKLTANKFLDDLSVVIYNMNGIPVMKFSTQHLRPNEDTNLQLDINMLHSATYIVEFKNKDHIVYKKFIKM